jgi:hypothetical protein|tara:strand:- start:100 stop:384 length:285 start_codon:yes stop_codon:yes gene_type:complete
MRVVTFVVSVFCSFGAQAQSFIKDIGRVQNLFVPPSIAPESSWATLTVISFMRMAVTMQVCTRVAALLREHLLDNFSPPAHTLSVAGSAGAPAA